MSATKRSVKDKWKVYHQSICTDCLQALVNGESGHTEEELKRMNETLGEWEKQEYVPAGLGDDTEPSFSWKRCELCHGLAGDRYEYNFFDKSNTNSEK